MIFTSRFNPRVISVSPMQASLDSFYSPLIPYIILNMQGPDIYLPVRDSSTPVLIPISVPLSLLQSTWAFPSPVSVTIITIFPYALCCPFLGFICAVTDGCPCVFDASLIAFDTALQYLFYPPRYCSLACSHDAPFIASYLATLIECVSATLSHYFARSSLYYEHIITYTRYLYLTSSYSPNPACKRLYWLIIPSGAPLSFPLVHSQFSMASVTQLWSPLHLVAPRST